MHSLAQRAFQALRADEFDADDLRYGGTVGLGADLSIGPLYLAYGRADEGYDCFYFSLGTLF